MFSEQVALDKKLERLENKISETERRAHETALITDLKAEIRHGLRELKDDLRHEITHMKNDLKDAISQLKDDLLEDDDDEDSILFENRTSPLQQ